MKTLHVTTPEIAFDVEVPAEQAASRAMELSGEIGGTVTL